MYTGQSQPVTPSAPPPSDINQQPYQADPYPPQPRGTTTTTTTYATTRQTVCCVT